MVRSDRRAPGHGTEHADITFYATHIDMNTGTARSLALTMAGSTLVYRQPEGTAVYHTSGGENGPFPGFGSLSSMTNADRYANIFHKNVLVA